MSTATEEIRTNDQVVRLKVPWSTYEALVAGLTDDSHARLAYDGEVLEIVSPGSTHEFIANLVADMLAVVRLEWAVPLTNVGSTTFKTEPRGFEADKAYYLDGGTRIADIDNINLAVDPPPDLLVEIDISSDSSDKLATTYAPLRVPEVWRYRGAGLAAFALAQGRYVQIETSRVIAGLPIAEIARRLENRQNAKADILAFMSDWQQWLRDNRQLHDEPLP